jgi:hypothetical protein
MPKKRKFRRVSAIVEPTPELIARKREAGAVRVFVAGNGEPRVTVDVHASTDPLDVLQRAGPKIGITEAEARAGSQYARLRHSLFGSPHALGIAAKPVADHVGGDGLEDVRDLDDSDPEERAARRLAAWRGATTAILQRAGRESYDAVITVAVMGEGVPRHRLPALREGLAVLVRRWRISDGHER